jgi:hypothetical protein
MVPEVVSWYYCFGSYVDHIQKNEMVLADYSGIDTWYLYTHPGHNLRS